MVSGNAVRGEGKELPAKTSMGCQENPGNEGVTFDLLW